MLQRLVPHLVCSGALRNPLNSLVLSQFLDLPPHISSSRFDPASPVALFSPGPSACDLPVLSAPTPLSCKPQIKTPAARTALWAVPAKGGAAHGGLRSRGLL